MHICFVLDENLYRPAGVQVYILGIADQLLADGHKVTILHSENKSVHSYEIDPRITVYDIAKGFEIPFFSPNGGVSVFPGIASTKKIRSILSENEFDVFHFNYPFSPLISSKLVKEINRHEQRTKKSSKKVASFHVYVEESKIKIIFNKILGLLVRKSVRSIDTFINTGTPTHHYGRKYLGRDSVYIPIGIETETEHMPTKQKNTIDILFLGRLQTRKGVLEYIEALNKVQPKHLLDNVRISVAGDGPERAQAEEKAKEYNLDISFLGTVIKGKKELLQQTDIAIFPTKYGETFGIVLLEAMNNHAITIGYANEGYKSTMKHLASDYLVQSENTDELAELLSQLLQKDRAELIEIQQLHKAFCDEHYNATDQYKKLLNLYTSSKK